MEPQVTPREKRLPDLAIGIVTMALDPGHRLERMAAAKGPQTGKPAKERGIAWLLGATIEHPVDRPPGSERASGPEIPVVKHLGICQSGPHLSIVLADPEPLGV